MAKNMTILRPKNENYQEFWALQIKRLPQDKKGLENMINQKHVRLFFNPLCVNCWETVSVMLFAGSYSGLWRSSNDIAGQGYLKVEVDVQAIIFS